MLMIKYYLFKIKPINRKTDLLTSLLADWLALFFRQENGEDNAFAVFRGKS